MPSINTSEPKLCSEGCILLGNLCPTIHLVHFFSLSMLVVLSSLGTIAFVCVRARVLYLFPWLMWIWENCKQYQYLKILMRRCAIWQYQNFHLERCIWYSKVIVPCFVCDIVLVIKRVACMCPSIFHHVSSISLLPCNFLELKVTFGVQVSWFYVSKEIFVRCRIKFMQAIK